MHQTRERSTARRVRQACEWCRVRKVKCNAKFPCHKCTESGLFCQEAARLKPRVRRPSDRYLQTLETNRLFLTETVQQLYAMIRSCTPWVLGEPGLDEYGRPILHDIAQCLGLLRPDNRATPTPTDTSSLPEDEMHATTLLPVTTDVTITFSDANVSITPVERKLYSFLPDMASPLIESEEDYAEVAPELSSAATQRPKLELHDVPCGISPTLAIQHLEPQFSQRLDQIPLTSHVFMGAPVAFIEPTLIGSFTAAQSAVCGILTKV